MNITIKGAPLILRSALVFEFIQILFEYFFIAAAADIETNCTAADDQLLEFFPRLPLDTLGAALQFAFGPLAAA